VLPALRIVGGCCGTDDRHVATLAAALAAPVRSPQAQALAHG
jgi:hypothetical protein